MRAAQALPQLQSKLRIERARMRLRLVTPLSAKPELDRLLAAQGANIEYQDLGLNGQQLTTVCLADPGCYRAIHALAASLPGGRLEVIALAATGEGSAQDAFDAGPAAPMRPAAAAPAAEPVLASEERRNGVAAAPAGAARPAPQRRASEPGAHAQPDPGAEVLYAAGPIAELPERYAARRERFAELDTLQPGWSVELRGRRGGDDAVDAFFVSPAGDSVGSFANARRAALAAHKMAACTGS
ncbi:hypothetical protein WJX81_000571 [Elliptochloris bilobata]|uniref:Uncharacterized protein n=1 Tax=Elliptochloris bilobata TaxID=381761 RepID=A0AAW1SEV5_9CHLO